MTKKMSGKQETSGAFDLDAFVNGGDSISKSEPIHEGSTKAQKRSPVTNRTVNPVGRPPVAKDAARSQNVQIKLTKAEVEKLKEKAGLVPISTYLRARLTELGEI